METFKVSSMIQEIYSGMRSYNSSTGYGYAMCKDIIDYLNENEQNEVTIDFEQTDVRSPFVYESISYIVTSFNDDMLARTTIINSNIYNLLTQLNSIIDNLELYKSARDKLNTDQRVQKIFK